jgi:outer membrane cobalamin receptor
VFGQGDVGLGPVRFYGGVRHQFTGQHDDTFVSANGGATVGLRELRLRASGYRSFRAPTLNELFRPFRVGNVLTLANPDLGPESLVGVETGVDWIREETRVSVTLFRYDLSNLLTNVTIAQTNTQITRQRENYPSALSRGVQADFAQRWHNWAFNAGYLFADARIAAGQRIPQVPKQQGTSQLTYTHNKTFLSFGLRAYGLQFDDDVNQFKLPGFASLGASAEQRVGHGISILASLDNLLDRTYLVALTPTPNTGQPLLWRLGLRWTSF